MEVAILGGQYIKIRGKHATIAINPDDKTSIYEAAIMLGNQTGVKINDDAVVIDGPGEYEIGGIKISGIRSNGETVYSLAVDGVVTVLGSLDALSKVQTKLQDSHVVLVKVSDIIDASFVTSLAPNVLMFYGEKADEAVKTIEKEGIITANKYQVSYDKLPSEMLTVLLQ